ncbi:hypothetical protein GUITHDRAFT_103486 [Guillardia theta CCMP2712]|uniref:COMM domain-containing protein 3 n=1 Tax=Guillardia theta (strain CCMP2712) TaxID=905079 RepID=L1JR39_GUITC|nr:hypothetical protein GUITHDRAFT_103486 [Guillardia theta CCMP2712]EKX50902.1 hypothetical protein GUITHDRAFT_103486 [Guillardia theta CCMP2712]|eukprot:XP_005837882.1 hypothetical protein GUITHDRAFT_103486 [Guillardia theta CCMP2712]
MVGWGTGVSVGEEEVRRIVRRAKGLREQGGGQDETQFSTGLTSALLEAAKADTLPADFKCCFRATLLDQGLTDDRADLVARIYEEEKTSLRKILARTQFTFPQLTGVTWRLDFVVKTKHVDHAIRPLFHVRFHTVKPDGSEEDIDFTCTEEELSDLHDTLKQACHQVTMAMNSL